ncbi:MAG: MFS transporter [Candidatus Heimdallarchaeaceae archaeon]
MRFAFVKTWVKGINQNVQLTFFFSFFNSLGRGIWLGNVLSAYIYFIAGKSNVLLGWTSAATGLSMTLLVFPAGILADRVRRDLVLKIAALFGLISLGIMIIFGDNIYWIFAALVFWGAFQGFNRPGLEAILADSIPTRRRSKVYVWLYLIRQIAMAVGPFLNVFLFLYFGDEWALPILRKVMIVGIVISGLSIIGLFFFDDSKSLGKSSEAVDSETIERDLQNGNRSNNKIVRKRSAKLFVPGIILASNLIVGMGAGMTIKFFPVFFIEIYGLQPISVQLIMGILFIGTGAFALVARSLSLKRGRILIIYILQMIATACLFAIAFYPTLWVLLPLFITRGSLMNAGEPLSRSILMDYVPKRFRGIFNSLQAIAWGLFWNISAVIGGYLIGENNRFNVCFFTTAGVYLVGVSLLLLLLPYDLKEQL